MSEANSTSNGKEQDKKSRSRTIAIIGGVLGAVVIIALIAVIVILLGRTSEPAPVERSTTGSRGTVVTPENVDEIRASMDSPVEDGYYRSKMNIDWVFPTAKTPSENAYVENPETNTRTVYFDLTLESTGQLIYSSDFIPVGGMLTGFSLDADLPAGDYPAVVTYHLVDDEDNELSTVSVAVTVRVQG